MYELDKILNKLEVEQLLTDEQVKAVKLEMVSFAFDVLHDSKLREELEEVAADLAYNYDAMEVDLAISRAFEKLLEKLKEREYDPDEEIL